MTITNIAAASFSTRGEALMALSQAEERIAALQPAVTCGPSYNRRAADALRAARLAWDLEGAGACLVEAEIAAGLRPQADWKTRFQSETFQS